MPYYIKHTNGSSLVTVQDGTVDNTTTSVTLVGKNFPTYGEVLNQNLISMLENSANSTSPDPALTGQLWYDSTNKVLNFYRQGSTSNSWQKIATTIESDTAPTSPRMGDLWWDTSVSQLKIYDTMASDWQVIGPQTTNNGRLTVIGTNNFTLQVSGNNVFQVDLYGGVVKPYNPCFSGYDNTNGGNLTSSGLTSYNTWKPKLILDRSSNFNVTSGVFTVQSPGYYRLNASVTTLGTTEVRLQWWKNGVSCNINAKNNVATASQLTCSGIITAITGDSFQLVYSTDSGASISNTYSTYQIEFVG